MIFFIRNDFSLSAGSANEVLYFNFMFRIYAGFTMFRKIQKRFEGSLRV